MKRQRSLPTILGLMALACLFSTNVHGADAKDEPVTQAALEKKFEQSMNNVAMVGSFTVTGKDDKLSKERYVITKVTKVQEGFWLFHARIQYGRNDVTVPLLLEVKWAGDTPVIVVDKVKVPGMGTYSARVLIYNNQYVGTWDAGDHGGQMFGHIEKNKEKPSAGDAK